MSDSTDKQDEEAREGGRGAELETKGAEGGASPRAGGDTQTKGASNAHTDPPEPNTQS